MGQRYRVEMSQAWDIFHPVPSVPSTITYFLLGMMDTHISITIDGRETRVKKPGAGEIVPIVSKKMIFGIN